MQKNGHTTHIHAYEFINRFDLFVQTFCVSMMNDIIVPCIIFSWTTNDSGYPCMLFPKHLPCILQLVLRKLVLKFENATQFVREIHSFVQNTHHGTNFFRAKLFLKTTNVDC